MGHKSVSGLFRVPGGSGDSGFYFKYLVRHGDPRSFFLIEIGAAV